MIKLGLYPNKSLTVKFPTIIPKKFLPDFLRGYLDGDGCVYLYTSKGIKQENIIRKLSVIFTSGSFDFLTGLCNTLKIELDLDNGKVYNSHRSFQLRYSTRDSLKVFKFLYKDRRDALYLQRKFEVFCTYFRRRSSRIDIETALILSKDGAVAKW